MWRRREGKESTSAGGVLKAGCDVESKAGGRMPVSWAVDKNLDLQSELGLDPSVRP